MIGFRGPDKCFYIKEESHQAKQDEAGLEIVNERKVAEFHEEQAGCRESHEQAGQELFSLMILNGVHRFEYFFQK